GCCCDYRRAVIVVSILFICATAITLILNVTAASIPGVNNANDDEVEDILNANTTVNIIISAVGLAMAIVGLVGARIYNIPMLLAVCVWYLVNFGLYIWAWIANINAINDLPQTTTPYRYPIGLIIFQAVVTGLWMYPHIGLSMEIQKGIMSRETYPREEYSCCCVDKRNSGYSESRTRNYQ
ncbi:MAG: hypothetical protein SGARI_007617, partial [Bacillariaceae sp.]